MIPLPPRATRFPYTSVFRSDGAGNVFVTDTNNNLVKEIVAVSGAIPSTATILTLGNGFNLPFHIAVHGAGDVFVADFGNNLVKEIVAVNGAIPTPPSGFDMP